MDLYDLLMWSEAFRGSPHHNSAHPAMIQTPITIGTEGVRELGIGMRRVPVAGPKIYTYYIYIYVCMCMKSMYVYIYMFTSFHGRYNASDAWYEAIEGWKGWYAEQVSTDGCSSGNRTLRSGRLQCFSSLNIKYIDCSNLVKTSLVPAKLEKKRHNAKRNISGMEAGMLTGYSGI